MHFDCFTNMSHFLFFIKYQCLLLISQIDYNKILREMHSARLFELKIQNELNECVLKATAMTEKVGPSIKIKIFPKLKFFYFIATF